MPEISIIVPVYNVEPYLARCIDSILAQTFTDFELILIDDGSPDRCGEICDGYAQLDSRVKAIHQKNAGVSAARNTGLDVALGRYVMFCDSDDTVDPEWCNQMVKAISRVGICIATCGYQLMNRAEEKIGEHGIETECASELSDFPLLFKNSLLNCIWNSIYHADRIKENGLRFDTSVSLAEDKLFVLNYLYLSDPGEKIVALNGSLYNYYILQSEDSLTKKYNSEYWVTAGKLEAAMERCCKKFDVDRVKYKQVFDRNELFTFFLAINNIYSRKNSLTFIERYQQCKTIVQSVRGRNFIDRILTEKDIPSWFCRIYRTHSAFLITLTHTALHIKDRIIRKS